MGVFCDRLNLGSSSTQDCETGEKELCTIFSVGMKDGPEFIEETNKWLMYKKDYLLGRLEKANTGCVVVVKTETEWWWCNYVVQNSAFLMKCLWLCGTCTCENNILSSPPSTSIQTKHQIRPLLLILSKVSNPLFLDAGLLGRLSFTRNKWNIHINLDRYTLGMLNEPSKRSLIITQT